MKKYAFHLQKGGVGKTTISGNIAGLISKTEKTILIDADPQGNITSWFIQESFKNDLSSVLSGDAAPGDAIIKLSENFHILPTKKISGNLRTYSKNTLPDEPFIFDDLNGELEKLGYSICIYDLGPGMNLLESSVIKSIDEVITPMTPEFFSLDGIEIFTNELKNINKTWRRNVKHNKIVCNLINKSYSRHNEAFAIFQDLDYDLFTLPQDAKLAECLYKGKSIVDYYPKSKAIPELQKLCEAMLCQ